ncbi:hypothetical protein HDU76_007427, partial [Blyttiomyces sp. JEL0837]
MVSQNDVESAGLSIYADVVLSQFYERNPVNIVTLRFQDRALDDEFEVVKNETNLASSRNQSIGLCIGPTANGIELMLMCFAGVISFLPFTILHEILRRVRKENNIRRLIFLHWEQIAALSYWTVAMIATVVITYFYYEQLIKEGTIIFTFGDAIVNDYYVAYAIGLRLASVRPTYTLMLGFSLLAGFITVTNIAYPPDGGRGSLTPITIYTSAIVLALTSEYWRRMDHMRVFILEKEICRVVNVEVDAFRALSSAEIHDLIVVCIMSGSISWISDIIVTKFRNVSCFCVGFCGVYDESCGEGFETVSYIAIRASGPSTEEGYETGPVDDTFVATGNGSSLNLQQYL